MIIHDDFLGPKAIYDNFEEDEDLDETENLDPDDELD